MAVLVHKFLRFFTRKRLNSLVLGLADEAFEDCKHQKTDAHQPHTLQ